MRTGPSPFGWPAEKLHHMVMDLQSQKPHGWIIDLRGNSGGNMWPMLAGIGDVIGEGDLGMFISAYGDRDTWFYKAGKAGTRTADGKEEIVAEIKAPSFVFPNLPWIAVLFDRGTASSGEAVAISLVGRVRARSFGEPSAGFSTANDRFSLPDGAALFLCDGIEADRTGNVYADGLKPDVQIPAPESRPPEIKDAVLQAAQKWLSEQIPRATSATPRTHTLAGGHTTEHENPHTRSLN
jgi:carboxyl-terminal processing protease